MSDGLVHSDLSLCSEVTERQAGLPTFACGILHTGSLEVTRVSDGLVRSDLSLCSGVTERQMG